MNTYTRYHYPAIPAKSAAEQLRDTADEAAYKELHLLLKSRALNGEYTVDMVQLSRSVVHRLLAEGFVLTGQSCKGFYSVSFI